MASRGFSHVIKTQRNLVFVSHPELCWQGPQPSQQVGVLCAETSTCDHLTQSPEQLQIGTGSRGTHCTDGDSRRAQGACPMGQFAGDQSWTCFPGCRTLALLFSRATSVSRPSTQAQVRVGIVLSRLQLPFEHLLPSSQVNGDVQLSGFLQLHVRSWNP